MPERRRWQTCWPYLLLAALVLVFFGDLLWQGTSFIMRDTFCNVYPWHVYARQSLAAGEFPWWNPYSGYGKPFIADIEVGFFYPLNLVFLILPAMPAFKLCWMLHFWIAGAGMFALCRYWRLGVTAALLAAVAFMFSTFTVVNMESQINLVTTVWVPLVLLLLNRVADVWVAAPPAATPRQIFRSATRPLVLLALVTAVQFLSGHAEFFLFSCLFYGIFFGLRCARELRGWRLAGLVLAVMLSGILMVGLVALQLGPMLEFVPYTDRGAVHDAFLASGSFAPRQMLTMAFPFLFGKLGDRQYWAPSVGEFTLGTCYLGLLPLLLAPCSLLYLSKKNPDHVRRFLVLVLLLLGLGGLVMAMGRFTPIAPLIYEHVPIFAHLRWPSKFLFWAWIAGATLAGFGCQRLLDAADSPPDIRRLRWLGLAAFAVFIAAASLPAITGWDGLVRWLTGRTNLGLEQLAVIRADYLLALLFFGGAGGLLALRTLAGINRTAVEIAIVLLVFVNLYVIGRQVHPVLPDTVYTNSPDRDLLAAFKSDSWRVHSDYALSTPYLYGNPDPEVYDWATQVGLEDRWLPSGIYSTYAGGFKFDRNEVLYRSLRSFTRDRKPSIAVFANVARLMEGIGDKELNSSSTKIVKLQATGVVVSNALPRAFLVTRWLPVSDRLLLPPEFLDPDNARRAALVEYVPGQGTGLPAPPEIAPDAPAYPLPDAVRVFQPRRNAVHLEVEANSRSMLVLADTWYPGWRVYVDKHEQPIYRANLWFRGVFLEPGFHDVDFIYRPSHWLLYLSITLCALALSAAAWIYGRRP